MRDAAVRWFLVGWALAVLPMAAAVIGLDRFSLHLAMNGHHTALLDVVFRYGTHLCDTPVPIIVALLMLARDLRSFLLVGLSAGLSAVVAQLIKHGLAAHMDRPTMFLDLMPGLPLVTGVEHLQHNSFPSGHTTAAYSTLLAVAVLVGRRAPAFLFALLAAFIGLSRIYLSQHFTEDVLAGAVIGTLTALTVRYVLYDTAFATRPWLHRSPLRRQNQ